MQDRKSMKQRIGATGLHWNPVVPIGYENANLVPKEEYSPGIGQ
jgi:hypothetical protein